MLREFTYANYRVLLDRVRDSRENLCFGDCGGGIPAERFFLLRHDIDFCPARALEMAQVEAEMGVRATYFLLLTTSHYNLLEKRFIAAPRQIVQMGHEVGLHYDVAALEAAGFKAELAEVIMKPQTEVEFTGDDAIKMQKLLDVLENLDDVQEVFTNAVIGE
jgi:hypothetical protein